MTSLQNVLNVVTSPAVVQSVGWLLVHSLWQCMLIALVTLCIAKALRRQSSSARYWMYSLALTLIVIAPVLTMLAFPRTDALPFDNDEQVQNVSVELMGDLRQIDGDNSSSIPLVAAREEERVAASEISGLRPGSDPGTGPVASLGWIKATLSPWLPTIVTIWCCGVSLFSIRPIWGWMTVRRLLHVGVSPVATHVQEALQRVCAKMKVRRRVEVLASTLVGSPIVVGCLRSVILVPASFVSNLPIAQLEAVLAHELAHVRRYDYLVNLLQTLVETLFFYHPAVWWLSYHIRMERENCCDDFVVAVLDNKSEYGRALLAVEEFRGSAARSALALSARDGSLLARINRLLADSSGDDRRGSAGWVVMGLALIGLAVAVCVLRNAHGDEDKKALANNFIGQITDQVSVELLAVQSTNVKTALRAGRWQITDDAELEITQKVFHATDIMTSGVIRLQGDKHQPRHVPLSIAGDYFANRERWKAVWEEGRPVLWYAKGLGDGPGRTLPPGTKVKIEELRRIDFSNPNCVVHRAFTGWVAGQLHPAEIRTALEQEFEIKPDGQESYRYYESARQGLQPNDTSQQLFVWMEENGNCQVQNLAWAPTTGEGVRR